VCVVFPFVMFQLTNGCKRCCNLNHISSKHCVMWAFERKQRVYLALLFVSIILTSTSHKMLHPSHPICSHSNGRSISHMISSTSCHRTTATRGGICPARRGRALTVPDCRVTSRQLGRVLHQRGKHALTENVLETSALN